MNGFDPPLAPNLAMSSSLARLNELIKLRCLTYNYRWSISGGYLFQCSHDVGGTLSLRSVSSQYMIRILLISHSLIIELRHIS